ncbi:MAG TPA: UDP-N-acetylmuramate--L-alanine ligase [Humisphaera sp.]|nr:UDP-N-acetylmuramate--L-alanine ligase [Humisphaera sp.]
MPLVMQDVISEKRMESRSATVSRFAGKRVHFIGIGGSGMSGLARMLLDAGAIVSGSEPKLNPQTEDLKRRGVQISTTQTGELLTNHIDLVVRTAAIPETNAEFLLAGELQLPQMKYARLLGEVMAERFGVAIAGTHGKSTTTAMTAFALLECGADPSFVVGGTSPQLGGGSRSGAGPVFVAEACEYDRSFHNLRPTVACITNIEADHLDCYHDLHDIIGSFRTFAELTPLDGVVLANGADPSVTEALKGISAPVQTVAIDHPATWSTRVTGEEWGCYRGEISSEGKVVARLRLSIAALHNLFNATLAVAACAACGIDPAEAAEAIGRFTGVDRRMTEMGLFNGAMIVDDYGHHPTEIRATLEALRNKYKPTRLLCVFQPHQASRTRLLFDDFATSFMSTQEAILADIFYVRDSDDERDQVSSAKLVEKIKSNGQSARHLADFTQIKEYLRREARTGDLIVTMGAGPVWEIGRDLVRQEKMSCQLPVISCQ